MRKKYLFLAISIIFLFRDLTFAGKLPIEIENNHYPINSKLEGLIKWREKEETQTFEISIPPKKEKKITLTEDIDTDPANISDITFLLCNDEKIDHEDHTPTLLAEAQFKPEKAMIKLLKIRLGERKLHISPTYETSTITNKSNPSE